MFWLYKEGNDYYDPIVISYDPKDGTELEAAPAEITIDVKDKGKGIDASSINLLINGKQVNAQYDPETGRIAYVPEVPLESGDYTVKLSMKDMAGNMLNPELSFNFKIK